MPRKARQSRSNLVEQEGRIQLAIQALKNYKVTTIHQATVVFSVPLSTLHNHMKGAQYKAEQRNHTFRLSKTQEEALVKWILSKDCQGVTPRVAHVRQMALLILQAESPTPPKPLGKN
jgi:hypothetical protein